MVCWRALCRSTLSSHLTACFILVVFHFPAMANEECATGSCENYPLEIFDPVFTTLPDTLENGREDNQDPARMHFGKTVLILTGDQHQPSSHFYPPQRAGVWELIAAPEGTVPPWRVHVPLDAVLAERDEADPFLTTWHGIDLLLVTPQGEAVAQARTMFFTPPQLRHPTVLLYHHLGLGDHIVASGLVRSLAEQHQIVLVVVHQPYIKSFNRLFGDLKNVHPFAVDAEREIRDKSEEYFSAAGIRMMRVGYHLSSEGTDRKIGEGSSFAEVFYMHAGLPYSTRWSKWRLERVAWREEEVLDQAGVSGEFAFLHDDPSRGLYIDRSIVRQGLQIYHPNEGMRLSDVLFDYALMMERATELHLMDSSFALLADHLDLSNVSRKVIHVYARLNPDGSPQVIAHNKLYQQDWELVREPLGVYHFGLFLSHPLDASSFHLGEPFLDDVNPEQVLILSIADYAPIPKGARIVVHVDNTVMVDSPLETREPWSRGACAYTLGGASMNFGPATVRRMWAMTDGTRRHVVSVTLLNAQREGPKVTSTFTIHPPTAEGDDREVQDGGGEGEPGGGEEAGGGGEQEGLVVPISNGEGMDKLSILEIKRVKIRDAQKLHNVEREYRLLKEHLARRIDLQETEDTYLKLLDVNRRLWEVEDDVRRCEATQDFGAHFVQLARSVYKLNDERGRLKRELNLITESGLIEEKMYTKY